jgi:oligopeptide transport system ATP-binding protein
MTALLSVANLSVSFRTPRGTIRAVDDVSFNLQPGKCLGIVGESGSGKSQTMLGLLGLVPENGRVRGSVRFEGTELIGAPETQLARLRGDRIALVFQDSITGLTPHMRIGDQLAEVLIIHRAMSQAQAREEARMMMEIVQIPDSERRMRQYPHELSGGMRQRAMIAMALLCKPALVIADEPTTALDVTVQAAILRALRKLKDHTGTAILLITHDLGVVAGLSDDVAVMYGGRIVEQGSVQEIFDDPRHPYTAGLLACMPRLTGLVTDDLPAISGQPPDPATLGAGCAFSPRCPKSTAQCQVDQPASQRVGARLLACHHAVLS